MGSIGTPLVNTANCIQVIGPMISILLDKPLYAYGIRNDVFSFAIFLFYVLCPTTTNVNCNNARAVELYTVLKFVLHLHNYNIIIYSCVALC